HVTGVQTFALPIWTDSGTYVWSSVDTTWLAKEIGEVTEFHREPPPGLQITDDGVILGKPTAFGSFLWTVNVKDASGGPGVDCPIRFDVPRDRGLTVRSEEHTSELQSRENLVCRLLLEKKN